MKQGEIVNAGTSVICNSCGHMILFVATKTTKSSVQQWMKFKSGSHCPYCAVDMNGNIKYEKIK